MVVATTCRRSPRLAALRVSCTKPSSQPPNVTIKKKINRQVNKNKHVSIKVVSETAVIASVARSDKAKEASLSRKVEKELQKQHEYVCGVDEAGRGPLAGPVVAAACILDDDVDISGILDSKLTTEKSRVQTYEELIQHPGVVYEAVRIEHDEIDQINILQASLKAMRIAAEGAMRKKLESLLSTQEGKGNDSIEKPSFIAMIDGPRIPTDMPMEAIPVIKGDRNVYSIAAASIIAKVTRDRIMDEYDTVYPVYGLKQHKGYPTVFHRQALRTHGPCAIHRLSYGPVKSCIKTSASSSTTKVATKRKK